MDLIGHDNSSNGYLIHVCLCLWI